MLGEKTLLVLRIILIITAILLGLFILFFVLDIIFKNTFLFVFTLYYFVIFSYYKVGFKNKVKYIFNIDTNIVHKNKPSPEANRLYFMLIILLGAILIVLLALNNYRWELHPAKYVEYSYDDYSIERLEKDRWLNVAWIRHYPSFYCYLEDEQDFQEYIDYLDQKEEGIQDSWSFFDSLNYEEMRNHITLYRHPLFSRERINGLDYGQVKHKSILRQLMTALWDFFTLLVLIMLGHVIVKYIYIRKRDEDLIEGKPVSTSDSYNADMPEEKKMWQRFKGKGNTDDILTEKARGLSALVYGFAKENAKDLMGEFKNVDGETVHKFMDVLYEVLIFYIHFADRLAFQHLGPEQRNTFINVLFQEIKELLFGSLGDDALAFILKDSFRDLHNKRQAEYSNHERMFPEKNEDLNVALLWDLGKKIANILESEMSLRITTRTQLMLLSLKALQLPELFEG